MLKAISKVLMIFVLLMNLGASAVMAESDDPPVDESKYTPRIKLSSNTTVEIASGKTEEVIIEIKNVGSGRATNILVQAIPPEGVPVVLTLENLGGSDMLQQGATKLYKLYIKTDAGTADKTYAVKLQYNYANEYRALYEGSDTLNIKVQNPLARSNISLSDFQLSSPTINPGDVVEFSFRFMNRGSKPESYVRFSLEGLDPKTITVPSGLSTQIFTDLPSFVEQKTSFDIKAAATAKNGSYPIKLVTTTKSADGTNIVEEEVYYIGVGGSAEASGDAVIEVKNTSSPTKTYGVGENFTVAFDLQNISKFDCKNLVVKVNALEGNTVVPTSQSMISTRELKAGATKRYSFSFAATSAAKSQNYPLSFTIQYEGSEVGEDDKTKTISFNQYFGVNVSNPEGDKKEEDPEKLKNVPKIIVKSYRCDPKIVQAGGEFDLHMSFQNSHAEKLVKNIKVSLSVTDKDDKKQASIFSPVDASNTIYIDQISPKQTADATIRYYAIPSAQPQNYSINVNFEYEDIDGKQITAQEIVGVNVSQPAKLETSELSTQDFADMGMPVSINFDMFNTGKVQINNLKIMLDADVEVSGSKTTWIGNLEMGNSEYYDVSFMPTATGQLKGRVVISYDDPTGQHFEIPKEFSIMVNEAPPMDIGGDFPPPQEESGFFKNKKNIAISAGVAVAVLAAAFGGFTWYRKKKGNEFNE